MSGAFGIAPDEAADLLVRMGSYPGAYSLLSDPLRWRAYVRDAIIEPAIGRDALALATIRKPALLRHVFALAVALPAQVVSLQKLQGQLQDAGALETVAHYISLLQDAYLVAGLEKFSPGLHRRRAAPPKLVTLNNALLSATHPEGAPDSGRDPARFGAWVENACVAFAVNQAQQVTYWREEPLEVDAVIEGTWGSWAVEVKTSSYSSSDLRGLLEFSRRHPRFRPLVVTAPGEESAARRLGIAALNWKEFLIHGPAFAPELS
jgi:predicted AAA+ superfamily ATPase